MVLTLFKCNSFHKIPQEVEIALLQPQIAKKIVYPKPMITGLLIAVILEIPGQYIAFFFAGNVVEYLPRSGWLWIGSKQDGLTGGNPFNGDLVNRKRTVSVRFIGVLIA